MTKILFIRFSSIGDIVLTTPAVRMAKAQIAGAEIHYLTKVGFKTLLAPNPNINKIYTVDSSISEVINQLKAEKYDLIIDLHHNLRSWTVKQQLGVKSFAFNKENWKKWQYVKLKKRNVKIDHVVKRYLSTLATLGVKDDGKGLDFFIESQNELKLPIADSIALVIGAKQGTKRIPLHKLEEIISQSNAHFVLLGGKEDEGVANELELKYTAKIYNAVGKYNLQQSASILKQCKKVITGDTGLMHIAAAFQKEIISIWGNTTPQIGFSPYLPNLNNKIIEVKDLSCRPCSKIGYDTCPKKHFKCMNEISVNQILDNL